MRDTLYESIESALSQPVDPDTLELCAASLLRELFPTLVPVFGGQDAGMDAVAGFADTPAMVLVATTGQAVLLRFPQEHWWQLHSTNPLERLHKEIKRRTDVVGIFPNRAALLRLVSAVLEEAQGEWVAQRRNFSRESMRKLKPPASEPAQSALLAAGA